MSNLDMRRKRANKSAKVGALMLSLTLSSCAASPRVAHSIVRSPSDRNDRHIATYALQENVVAIRATTTGEGNNQRTTIAATLDRQDHQGLRIALLSRDSFGVHTGLTIKSFDNTDIPSEITTKVEDTRADLVSKVGEVIIGVLGSGLIPFTASEPPLPAAPTLPLRVNLSQAIGTTPQRGAFTVNNIQNIRVYYGAVSPDAVPTASPGFGPASSFFYYAACRDARVRFRYGEQIYDYVFRVSDPHFLQRVRMPVDGKITMHTQCGASVTGRIEGDDASSALAITASIIAQAQAIREALETDDEEQ